jgi:hypothetical protein
VEKVLKILGVLLLLAILGFGWLLWNFNRPPFDLARLQQLRPGMSQTEVRGILGVPKSDVAVTRQKFFPRICRCAIRPRRLAR